MSKLFSYKLDIVDILTIVFIVLKLCKVITWSWWWVFSPLLIEISIAILFIILSILILLLGILVIGKK